MYNIPGWGYETVTSIFVFVRFFSSRDRFPSLWFVLSLLSSKISDCVWPCRSVAFALVIKNPLNARTFLSKAKLPNLVLCALLGKCPVAFIVLLMCFIKLLTVERS